MRFRIERFVNLFAFAIFVILTLIAVSVITIVLIAIAVDLGWLKAGPIEITAQAIVTAILGVTGLIGLALAYQKSLQENDAVKARFVFNLNDAFFRDDAERSYFYKLDHSEFYVKPPQFDGEDDLAQ